MNILQLSFHTSPFNEVGKNDGGGMSIYVQQISRHLSENNNVTVVTGEKAESFKDHNLEFISLNIFEPELNVEDKEIYLQEFKNKLGNKNIHTAESIEESLLMNNKDENCIFLCAGSLYLAGEVLNLN